MLQTIQTGSHISIQGEFVRKYDDGTVMVRVGKAHYIGKPVSGTVTQPTDQPKLAAVAS